MTKQPKKVAMNTRVETVKQMDGSDLHFGILEIGGFIDPEVAKQSADKFQTILIEYLSFAGIPTYKVSGTEN